MLLIPCPYCGPREETEFSYGGEAHIERPNEPDALSDTEWAYAVTNVGGPVFWYRAKVLCADVAPGG